SPTDLSIFFNKLNDLFDVTNNETITKTNIDKGKPINTGCRPKGCPAICQITATINPVHMDNTPASFVALFQNRPNNTGASKPETSIAVPATHKLTSCGIYKANNRNKRNRQSAIKQHLFISNFFYLRLDDIVYN